ncbi:hypothetical protein [Nostoc sp.]|uniref:hypothetical protein n=1 Tax=Nostoc sp. TaxID=1180 RepID=UPI002FFAF19B
MLVLERAKIKTSLCNLKDNNQQRSKYQYFLNSRRTGVSPISIPENYKRFDLAKDDNCDIYLDNQTKTQKSKASLLKTKNWNSVIYFCTNENLSYIFSERSLLQRNNPSKAKQITNRSSSYLLRQAELKETFIKLANQWHSETKHMSLISDMVLHPAYQQIIGMGKNAVPLILEELSREPEHWFWALKSITGANPVKPEDKGRLKKMTEAWLDWGRQHGYKC